jgi:hypothetical protein
MTSLIVVAAFLGCDPPRQVSYGYARQGYGYYQAPATTYYQQPAQTYYQPQQYQQPAYNYSLVGDYMRQESAYKASVEQAAKLDVLIKLLAERPALPPVQPPAPPVQQYQAPYPSAQAPSKAPPEQPQFQYPTAQQPTKAPPVEQFQYPGQPSQQYPSQQWSPSDQPPFATKPAPAPSPSPTPSFESSGWVPPPTSGGGAAAQAIALMTAGMQARCTNCHIGTSSEGGGVKLLELDGTLADITPYLGSGEGGIEKAITSGRMPKRGPRLNNQELYAFLAGLRAYEAQARSRANVVASFGQ